MVISLAFYYHKYFLNSEFTYQSESKFKTEVFLATGELELSEDPSQKFKEIYKKLSRMMNTETKIFTNLGHLGTMMPAFTEVMVKQFSKNN